MASGRVFSVVGTNQTLANQAVTLAFINPSSTVGIRLLRAWASQTGVTTSVMQRVQISTQVTAFPTLVSATPVRWGEQGGPASAITGGTAGAAGTAGINASAEGAGSKTVLLPDTFNVLSGWLYVPTPEERIELAAGSSSGLGLHLPAAAATLTGWSFGITFQEI